MVTHVLSHVFGHSKHIRVTGSILFSYFGTISLTILSLLPLGEAVGVFYSPSADWATDAFWKHRNISELRVPSLASVLSKYINTLTTPRVGLFIRMFGLIHAGAGVNTTLFFHMLILWPNFIKTIHQILHIGSQVSYKINIVSIKFVLVGGILFQMSSINATERIYTQTHTQ